MPSPTYSAATAVLPNETQPPLPAGWRKGGADASSTIVNAPSSLGLITALDTGLAPAPVEALDSFTSSLAVDGAQLRPQENVIPVESASSGLPLQFGQLKFASSPDYSSNYSPGFLPAIGDKLKLHK